MTANKQKFKGAFELYSISLLGKRYPTQKDMLYMIVKYKSTLLGLYVKDPSDELMNRLHVGYYVHVDGEFELEKHDGLNQWKSNTAEINYIETEHERYLNDRFNWLQSLK